MCFNVHNAHETKIVYIDREESPQPICWDEVAYLETSSTIDPSRVKCVPTQDL